MWLCDANRLCHNKLLTVDINVCNSRFSTLLWSKVWMDTATTTLTHALQPSDVVFWALFVACLAIVARRICRYALPASAAAHVAND